VCVTPMIRRRQSPGMQCATDTPGRHQTSDESTSCLDRCLKCITTSLTVLLVITSVVCIVSDSIKTLCCPIFNGVYPPKTLEQVPLTRPLLSPPLLSLSSGSLKTSWRVWGSAVSSPAGWGNPSQNRILCIFALKFDIWWQQS